MLCLCTQKNPDCAFTFDCHMKTMRQRYNYNVSSQNAFLMAICWPGCDTPVQSSNLIRMDSN